jgi:DNA topoisomerase-3
MNLILAEKPSVASDFAKALNASRKEGFYISDTYIITYCVGHLMELYEPEMYNASFKQWSISDLPIIPETFKYEENIKTKKQLSVIKTLCKDNSFETIIIATDAGREGELIARLVLNHCKPKMNRIKRFWSSAALTEQVIIKELDNIKDDKEYDNLYNSGLYRQWSDWIIGMNFSRLFTLTYNSLFTFGRVQTALVKLLYDRHNEIYNFQESYYFRLRARLVNNNIENDAYLLNNDNSINFDSKQLLLPFLSDKIIGKYLTVESINKLAKTVNPPQLYNLVNLQKDANKKYGYSAEQTLNIAQKLYEEYKCLSYPRTPSRVLSESNYELFLSKIEYFKTIYPSLFEECLQPDKNNKHIFDDSRLEDHHALLPLADLPSTASEQEKNVFNLILISLANITKKPYSYYEISVTYKYENLCFRSKFNKIIELGWKIKDSVNESEENEEEIFSDINIESIVVGMQYLVKECTIEDKKKCPPKEYTEASLLAVMEKYRLGTEATRANVIETILKKERDYCIRNKRNIVITDKGIFFIKSILALNIERLSNFINVEETANWEAMLEKAPKIFYSNICDFLKNTVTSVKTSNTNVVSYKGKAIAICPLCGNDIYESSTNYYCLNVKERKCYFVLNKSISGHKLTSNEFKVLLSGKPTKEIEFISGKTQKKYKATINLILNNKDKLLQFNFPTH